MTLVGSTPYVTPDILRGAPTGISWDSIPKKNSTPQQNAAALWNICQLATTEVDACTQVPLRATIDTEVLLAPGDSFRTQMMPNRTVRLVLSRPPVVSVLSGNWSPASAFPSQVNAIPANQFKVEYPLLGVYGTTAPAPGGDSGGQSVLLAGGFVNPNLRMATELTVTYLNGWPHASLTADVTAGATTVHVDDVCGWLGATGILREAYSQESAMVSAVVPDTPGALAGPGTLTLSSALVNSHPSGTLFSAIPYSVVEAAILYACSKSLTRGTSAIVAQSMAGREVSTQGNIDDLITEAELKLIPYKRVL